MSRKRPENEGKCKNEFEKFFSVLSRKILNVEIAQRWPTRFNWLIFLIEISSFRSFRVFLGRTKGEKSAKRATAVTSQALEHFWSSAITFGHSDILPKGMKLFFIWREAKCLSPSPTKSSSIRSSSAREISVASHLLVLSDAWRRKFFMLFKNVLQHY